MSSILQYFLMAAGAAVLLAAVIVYLGRLHGSKIYMFRQTFIAALCPFAFMMLLALGLSWPMRAEFSFTAFVLEFPPRFANLSIAAMGALALAMAVSNVSLMRHEGRSLKNVVGTVLELGWIGATLAVYALVCVIRGNADHFTGVWEFLSLWLPYCLYCLICYGECIMIGIMIMGWIAAHGKSAYDKDFIIIPGCSISKNGGLLPLLRGRVNRAMRYAWEQEIASGKPVCYIPSGGQGPDEVMSEGSAMGLYLMAHSAESGEVFPEKKSTNTAENFLFSARIIREKKPDAKTAFATTNYHVLRCGMLARCAGLNAEGMASTTKWYFWPNGFAREVAAIVDLTKPYHISAVLLILGLSLAICLVL